MSFREAEASFISQIKIDCEKYNQFFDNTGETEEEKNIEKQDDIFEDQGIKIVVDRRSLLYLLGTTLEFSDGLNGKGFQFVNPNASRTCGCGESFSL